MARSERSRKAYKETSAECGLSEKPDIAKTHVTFFLQRNYKGQQQYDDVKAQAQKKTELILPAIISKDFIITTKRARSMSKLRY